MGRAPTPQECESRFGVEILHGRAGYEDPATGQETRRRQIRNGPTKASTLQGSPRGRAPEYDSVERTALSDQNLTRLADHVSTTLDTLFRNPTDSRVAGLARYEGDRWRTGHQDSEKVWTVTTAMGALAAARVGDMLNDRDERGDAYLDRASDLYELPTRTDRSRPTPATSPTGLRRRRSRQRDAAWLVARGVSTRRPGWVS